MTKKNEISKEYASSALKGLIGGIPYVGTFINEIVFEARTRLKQERINRFIHEFSNYLQLNSKEKLVDLGKIKKDDFSDIFEQIIISVSKTSAEHKIEIFKKILFNQFTKDFENIDNVSRYISITNSISELQFKILSEFAKLSDRVLKYKTQILEKEKLLAETYQTLQKEIQLSKLGYKTDITLFEKRIKHIKTAISSKKKALRDLVNPNLAKTYNLKDTVFLVEIHDLISKGLLYDLALTTDMINVNENFGITKLGRDYINYVKK